MAYTAVVLENLSHLVLCDAFGVGEGWEYKAHHMTLHMGPHAPEVDPPIGERVELLAYQAAGDDKVIAVKVKSTVRSVNVTPHVTVAVNAGNGGKPVMSNLLSGWISIVPITLYGIVSEVC